MARTAQKPGELRDGLILYPGGKVWYYLVRWKPGEKPRRGSTGCASRTAAAEWLRKEKERWAAQEHEAPAPQEITLGEALALWLRVRGPEVSESHRRDMANTVQVHARGYLDRPLHTLDALALNELRSAYLSSTGAAPRRGGGTIARGHNEGGANQLVKNLRALVNWTVDKGLSAPPKTLKLTRLKPPPREKTVLWAEQFGAFLAAVDRLAKRRHQALLPKALWRGRSLPKRRQTHAHSSTACRLMLQLGLREDEARTLEWPNIDWRNRALLVTSSETLELDTEGRPKDRETRVLRIPPLLFEHLQLVWRENGEPEGGLVLASTAHKTPGPHHEQFTAGVVAAAGRAIGVQGLTPHALRRSFATAHWERGVSIKRIAEMLGHADPETTRKHYIVYRAQDHAADQDALEASTLGSGSTTVPPPKQPTQKRAANK